MLQGSEKFLASLYQADARTQNARPASLFMDTIIISLSGIMEFMGLLKNPTISAKSANAAKNRDWERGAIPRACTCFLHPPGSLTSPFNSTPIPLMSGNIQRQTRRNLSQEEPRGHHS
jgi:hypothetical protein